MYFGPLLLSRQAIIWTNEQPLLITYLETNLDKIQHFPCNKMKMSCAKWQPFCLGFNTSRGLFAYFGNWCNRPIPQIPQCAHMWTFLLQNGALWDNAPFCNRNVHRCAHFFYKMVHCGTMSNAHLSNCICEIGLLRLGKQGCCMQNHDDVIKWNHFPHYWPFVRGIHRSRWIPRTKASDAEFDVFFDLRLNKRLSKQPWGWWFETPSWSLWRQCNVDY